MTFWHQFLLQLISPIVGSAIIGGTAAWLTKRYQDRRLDREFRMSLVSRVSNIVYAIHTDLSFYERWVRHSRPASDVRDKRQAEVDKDFIAQRVRLGALQVEVDAYFGRASEPGKLLHQLTDLIMLRYAVILDLPPSQVTEIVDHLGRPGHAGYSIEELRDLLAIQKPDDSTMWPAVAQIEQAFTTALRDTVRAVLATKPITKTESFKSGKMLTAYDQLESTEPNAITISDIGQTAS